VDTALVEQSLAAGDKDPLDSDMAEVEGDWEYNIEA